MTPRDQVYRAFSAGLVLATFVVAAEIGARLDDRVFNGQPALESPTFEELFFTLDDGIRRGRPGAHWANVTLNNLGMRGPDLPPVPAPGCERWLFLGASETFGEPGIAGGDFPSVVRTRLPPSRCVEIANSASPGMGLRNIIEQFDAFGSRIGATTVVIYPNTQSYLADQKARRAPSDLSRRTPADEVPSAAMLPGATSSLEGMLARSRFVERLKQSAEVPAPIQRLRRRRWIDAELARHPSDWTWATLPLERLDSLESDVEALVGLIRASGARPVLMTHAVRSARIPRPEDHEDLVDMRVYLPRAKPEVLAAYEYAAAERIRQVATRLGVPLVDVAASISGVRDLFIDLVHFAPAGNDTVAAMLLRSLIPTTTEGARAVQ